MSSSNVRQFSVERKMRMGAGGSAGFSPIGGTPGDGGDVSIAELFAEVRALREELASVRQAQENDDGMKQDVRVEIAQMVRSIGRAKTEIASIKHPHTGHDEVEAASSQLDAIIQTTEDATNDIMEHVDEAEERLKKVAALTLDDPDIQLLIDQISEHLVNVIEACSFHDLTGQRITKVVGTLRFIESRILAMIDIWGLDAFQDLPVEEDEIDPDDDSNLLNGPALEGQGLSQADIDALFD